MTESGPQEVGKSLLIQNSDQEVDEVHSSGDIAKSENETDTPNSCVQFDASSPKSDLHQHSEYESCSLGVPSSPVDSLHSIDSTSSTSIDHYRLIQYMEERSLSSRERFIQWVSTRHSRTIDIRMDLEPR